MEGFVIKYSCDIRIDVIAITSWENKYDQDKIIDIGLTLGFEPTTLDDQIKIINIGPTVGFKPTTIQLKSGRSPHQAKHHFKNG